MVLLSIARWSERVTFGFLDSAAADDGPALGTLDVSKNPRVAEIIRHKQDKASMVY